MANKEDRYFILSLLQKSLLLSNQAFLSLLKENFIFLFLKFVISQPNVTSLRHVNLTLEFMIKLNIKIMQNLPLEEQSITNLEKKHDDNDTDHDMEDVEDNNNHENEHEPKLKLLLIVKMMMTQPL